jgi:lipid-A-disaccharide synthase
MSSILIIAGENSGEKHGARLVRQFKRIQPSFSFYGIGGNHMAEQGVSLLHTVEDLAVVGLFEVISHLPRIRKIFHHIKNKTREKRPAAALLIDSPDFNLRLAKEIKKLGIPILYYISPTVWAWRKKRLNTIKKSVDKMLLIFPFEEKIYAEHGIPAAYVGHPLKERVKISFSKEEFFQRYRLDPQKKLIAILPGSRNTEVKNHMPILTQVIERLGQEFQSQFVLPLAENISAEYVGSFLEGNHTNVTILAKDGYEAIAYSDIALSSCGTANLEAALLGTPAVAFYRLSPLTYHSGIKLMKIKHFSIVNILAGKKIIPELIQRNFTVENILNEAQMILRSERIKSEIKSEYDKICSALGDRVASENAARELERLIKNREKQKH